MAKEVADKFFIATRQDQLRTTSFALNILDKYFDATSDAVVFALDLLALRHDTDSFAELDAHNTRFDALDDTSDDRTNFIFKFRQHHFALSLAQALQDDLLGSLSCHAPKACDFV